MNLKHYSIVVILILLLASCANRGIGPQGGPKDSIPPVALRSEPELGALNFNGRRVEIHFNEYLQLSDLGANLIMSPPQQTPPEVKARGKRVLVFFQDTLRDSTTYTIDFGNAICDYTEKNPVRGFSFYFSTGNEIDTLETYGQVFDASNLNPLLGICAGIHSDMDDSAFITKPFDRIAKTDSSGIFRIGNIHPGTYRLYAVEDISRDYRLTLGESFAFADEPITVTPQTSNPQTPNPLTPNPITGDSAVIDTTLIDTISIDSTSIDTTSIDSVTRIPSPVTRHLSTLLLFKEEQQRLYLQRTLRDKRHLITLLFSSAPDSVPVLRPLTDSLHYFTHYSAHRDTITLWLLDSMSITRDSLYIEARYRRTDSLYNLEWYTDTLRAVWRAPRLTAKAKEAQEREARNRRLELKTNARKGFELFDTLRITCSTPLASIERDSIHLVEIVDTLRKPVPFTIMPYDTLPMQLTFLADLKEGTRYEMRLDSGALHDVYGITHIAGSYSLEVKKTSDYSTLKVRITPFDPSARIQVLNKQDKVLRELPAEATGTLFQYLKPDQYYLRLYLDQDGNGKWTTGSWEHKRQPEPVYYFSDKIQTKSNWDFEQEWDYLSTPQMHSKPAELIKASLSNKKK